MSKEKLFYDIISGIYLIVILILFISFMAGILNLTQTMKSNVGSSAKIEANKSFQNNALFSIKYSLIFGGIYSVLLVIMIFRFQKSWFERIVGIGIALLNLRMFAFGPIYYFFDIRKKIV